jgi:hypothetical protein
VSTGAAAWCSSCVQGFPAQRGQSDSNLKQHPRCIQPCRTPHQRQTGNTHNRMQPRRGWAWGSTNIGKPLNTGSPQQGFWERRQHGRPPTGAVCSTTGAVQYHRCSAVPQVQCAVPVRCGSPMRWQLWQRTIAVAVLCGGSCGSPMRWQLWQHTKAVAVLCAGSCGSAMRWQL